MLLYDKKILHLYYIIFKKLKITFIFQNYCKYKKNK